MKRLLFMLLAPVIFNINIAGMNKPGFTNEQQMVFDQINSAYGSVFPEDLDLSNGIEPRDEQKINTALGAFKNYLDKSHKEISPSVFGSIDSANKQILGVIKKFVYQQESSNFNDIYCEETKKLSQKLESSKKSINAVFLNKGLASVRNLSLEIMQRVENVLILIKESFGPEGLVCAYERKSGDFVAGLNEKNLVSQIDGAYSQVFDEIVNDLKNSEPWRAAIDNVVLFINSSGLNQTLISETNNRIASLNNNFKNTIKDLSLSKNQLDVFYEKYNTLIPKLSKEIEAFKAFIKPKSDNAVKNIANHLVKIFENLLNKIKLDFENVIVFYDKDGITKKLNFKFNDILNSNFASDKDLTKKINSFNDSFGALKIFIDNSKSKDFPKIFPEIIKFNQDIFAQINEIKAESKKNSDQINTIISGLNQKLDALRKKVANVTTYKIFRAGPTEVKEILQILVGVPAKGETPLKRGLYDKLIGKIYSNLSLIGASKK